MENNKAFTLTNDGKTFFLFATGDSCQPITNTKKKYKRLLYR
jgi:hypothetical protein